MLSPVERVLILKGADAEVERTARVIYEDTNQ